jgi:hypothetical protein
MMDNGKVSDLIRNYDGMTDAGKNELLLAGEKYLKEKERLEKEPPEDGKEGFEAE